MIKKRICMFFLVAGCFILQNTVLKTSGALDFVFLSHLTFIFCFWALLYARIVMLMINENFSL